MQGCGLESCSEYPPNLFTTVGLYGGLGPWSGRQEKREEDTERERYRTHQWSSLHSLLFLSLSHSFSSILTLSVFLVTSLPSFSPLHPSLLSSSLHHTTFSLQSLGSGLFSGPFPVDVETHVSLLVQVEQLLEQLGHVVVGLC